jgi:CRP-like cAMP-binding protein
MARKPTADELRKLKDKAAEAAAKGKLDKAAELYREAADGDARDVGTRQKLAEVLRRAGRIPEAIQAYRDVAERFGNDGLLIKAIAISKTILELDPQHVETQSSLAGLYAKKAAAEGARPPPRTLMVQAMKAAGVGAVSPREATPPPPAQRAAPPREDPVVSLPLAPLPPSPEPEVEPIEISIEAEPLPEPEPAARPPPRAQARFESRAPAAEPSTGFAQIAFAAEYAVQSGVEQDLLVLGDPIDLELIGDEPLSFGTLGDGEETPEATAEPEVLGEPDLRPEPEPLEIVIEPELEPEPLPVPAVLAPPPSRPAPRATPAASPPPPAPAARPVPPAARPAAAAARPAAARPSAPPTAPGLPRVPIFSDLSREAFLALTEGMVLHRCAAGEAVICEAEEGTSFYVIASGKFSVSKRDEAGGTVVLAKLGEGDFFGEMALLSGAARSATVTADEAAEVLEFRADVLLELAGHHPHVAQSLRRFYRQRLLANAMAVSPIFRPFQRTERKLLMERFRARPVTEGETVIREGDPSDGLYVVLEGAVDVVKGGGSQAQVVGHLREGDLFGEMSCLRKAPASASIVVKRSGTLLRLPRKEFDDLVVSYPQILEYVSSLSEERAENLDAIQSGHAEWTDDGLVLT